MQDELLLKIINSITTTDGRGMLLACRALSNLMRPGVFARRQQEARGLLVSMSACGAVSVWRVAERERLWVAVVAARFVTNIGGGRVLVGCASRTARTYDVIAGLRSANVHPLRHPDGGRCARC